MTFEQKRAQLKKALLSGTCVPAIGVYDVISARLVERAGFPAAYIGSYAVAASVLGEPDTGLNSLNDIVEQVRIVAQTIDIPLVADAEGGFNRPANLWRTVRDFETAGACAVHMEDHVFGKHTNFPMILSDIEVMENKIKASVDARKDENFMIFARTEAFYAYKDDEQRCIDETIERGNKYLEAGADAVFVSSLKHPSELAKVRSQINGPVVIPTGNQASERAHNEVGINLAIYWPFCLYAAFVGVREALDQFKQGLDYETLGKYNFDEHAFNQVINFDDFVKRVEKYGMKD